VVDGDADDHHGLGVLAADGEGRLLCLLLSFYAFAVFGYITASFASFFVGRDREEERAAGGDPEAAGLRSEVAALRAELRRLGGRDPP
jgi:voltage-gated potassium channel